MVTLQAGSFVAARGLGPAPNPLGATKEPVRKLQPWSQGLEKNHSINILPLPTPVQCCQNTFSVTQVCILPFSNIEKGNGGVDTYSVSITIMISCFWHFPTQFVQGCR